MSVLLLACVLAALGFLIWRVLRKGPKGAEGGLYRDLVQQAGGDTALADRLIDYELQRRPGLPRHQAIESAIWRLERDRN